MSRELEKARELAAHAIFRTGSCLVDTLSGFTLSVHEKLPEAPRSPFYLNLRPAGVKKGTLQAADIETIGRSMYLLGKESELFSFARPTCSIPAAGDPYLDAILHELERDKIRVMRILLTKHEIDDKRVFELLHSNSGAWRNTLLVDDLVTSLHTKEQAMKPIESAGGQVTDLLVFLDRSTDAKKKLAQRDIRLHAVWEFDQLMEWALGQGYLKRREFESIIAYPGQLEAYQRSAKRA